MTVTGQVSRPPLGRSQWPLTAAAAAAAILATVSIIVPILDGRNTSPLDTGTETQELGWRLVEGVPAGLQAISYRGVEVLVPAEWKINDYRCAVPAADTVLMPDGDPTALEFCYWEPPSNLTVVHLDKLDGEAADHPVAALAMQERTLRGERVLRGAGVPSNASDASDQREVLVVPGQGVVVSVESPDPDAAMQLLMRTRVVPIDSRGCVDRLDSLSVNAPSWAGAAQQLAPQAPETITICRYTDGRLVRSATLSSDQTDRLSSALSSAPEGVGSAEPSEISAGLGCAEMAAAERGFLIRLTYAEGPPVNVVVRADSCDAFFATNGSRTSVLTKDLFGALADAVDFDSSTPSLPDDAGNKWLPYGP